MCWFCVSNDFFTHLIQYSKSLANDRFNVQRSKSDLTWQPFLVWFPNLSQPVQTSIKMNFDTHSLNVVSVNAWRRFRPKKTGNSQHYRRICAKKSITLGFINFNWFELFNRYCLLMFFAYNFLRNKCQSRTSSRRRVMIEIYVIGRSEIYIFNLKIAHKANGFVKICIQLGSLCPYD